METRGAVASYDPGGGELTYYAATQSPHGVRFALSGLLNQPAHLLRVVSNDVGGAFGLKGFVYREDVALAATSKSLGRPVKWIEDRNEHLMASAQPAKRTSGSRRRSPTTASCCGLRAA